MCVRETELFLVKWDNLYEVSSAAVNADIRELHTDDLIGLSYDESGTSQLWPGRGKGEIAFGGQHVQASCKQHIHFITWTMNLS